MLVGGADVEQMLAHQRAHVAADNCFGNDDACVAGLSGANAAYGHRAAERYGHNDHRRPGERTGAESGGRRRPRHPRVQGVGCRVVRHASNEPSEGFSIYELLTAAAGV